MHTLPMPPALAVGTKSLALVRAAAADGHGAARAASAAHAAPHNVPHNVPRRGLRALALLLVASLLSACVVAPPRQRVVVVEDPAYPRHHRPGTVVPPPGQAAGGAAMPALYFYPERGQGNEQQDRDRYECYRWAVRQTGTDPGMTPVTRSAEPVTGTVSRDPGVAVAGAATGAVVGAAVTGGRGTAKGAVLGALLGGVMGAAAEESRAQQTEQVQDARHRAWEQREAARMAPVEDFRRAMSACMAGRGYAVR